MYYEGPPKAVCAIRKKEVKKCVEDVVDVVIEDPPVVCQHLCSLVVNVNAVVLVVFPVVRIMSGALLPLW